MNKKDLITTIASGNELTRIEAHKLVNHVFEIMTDALARGERIEIRGFGSFKVKEYESYKGRNPRTGEIVEVKPKKLPIFKVGSELKERVNNGTRVAVS